MFLFSSKAFVSLGEAPPVLMVNARAPPGRSAVRRIAPPAGEAWDGADRGGSAFNKTDAPPNADEMNAVESKVQCNRNHVSGLLKPPQRVLIKRPLRKLIGIFRVISTF
jgi:hypothetical protein